MIEYVFCGLCVAFMVYAGWRGGTANPVGTGQLQSQLNTMGGTVKGLSSKVENCANRSDLDQLRGEFKDMEARVASSSDIIGLQGQIAAVNVRLSGLETTVNARVTGLETLAARTDDGVRRIESILMKGALER